MKLRAPLFFLLIVSSVLLQACGPDTQAAIATGIAQTQQISALETAAAGGGAEEEAPAEAGPSDTPAPSVAFVSVTTDTHCRSGPRQDYSLLTTINIGQQVEVLKTFSNDYAVVKNPNSSGDCWLFLKFANTADFSAFNLPTATQPPTPSPAAPVFDWNGSWQIGVLIPGFIGLPLGAVTLTQTGSSLNGSFTYNGDEITISASLSSNFQTASGILTNVTESVSGPIQMQIKSGNLNQFVGSYVYDGQLIAICGARAGASSPSPCIWP